MDILDIGVSSGEKVNFMDQVHPTVKEQVKKYVRKAQGPHTLFRHADGTTPIQAVEKAFEPLKKFKDKIGVVIDGSTTRGFAEPSAAALYAQHLKLRDAICFDVSEACNGWARAAETAYMLYQTQQKFDDKYILIINNEQPPKGRGMVPKDPQNYKEIAAYYVGLSFSYVCTCTLLQKSDNFSWTFDHMTDTEYASYINVPLPQESQGFLPKTDHYQVQLNEEYGQFIIPKFHQFEKKGNFSKKCVNQRQQSENFYRNAHVVCHTFSKDYYVNLWKDYSFKRLSTMYDEFGNLGSCSFPFALHHCYRSKIPINQNLAFVGNAAGGSNVVISFKHRNNDDIILNNQPQNTSEVTPKRIMPSL